MPLNNNWLNYLESRNKHHATNVSKTYWQGTKYKNKITKLSPITLTYVLTDLFYYVYERPVPSFFHYFVVFNVLRICFLFSINDFRPDPLNSPGELSSQFLLLSFYFIHDQRTPYF